MTLSRPDLYNAARVIASGRLTQRFHCYHLNDPQRVDGHSWGVAMFVWLLSDQSASALLLMAALTHDLAESRTGDIPAPMKRRLGIGKAVAKIESEILGKLSFEPLLGPEESRLLQLADIADAIAWILHEKLLGNKTLDGMLQTYREYLATFSLSFHEQAVFGAIESESEVSQLGDME